ncbi:hypothetical protein [Saxibacter everestensis]|uniref:hypothetical protein n=1 Tax=Saxibacter everestensis TaxID=2909229 RepID=UPI003D80ACB2
MTTSTEGIARQMNVDLPEELAITDTRDGSLVGAQQAIAALSVGTMKINNVFGGAPGGSAQSRGTSGHGHGYGPELLDEMTRTEVVRVSAAQTASEA